MLLVDTILGSRIDPHLSERLHHLEHHGRVETVRVPAAELARRKFMAKCQSGEEIAISLPREQKLFDGAVILLDDKRAIVVRVDEENWLRLQPKSIEDAIELGYHAGNLHWRVRFDGGALLVALEAPAQNYLDRLGPLITERGVTSSIVQADK